MESEINISGRILLRDIAVFKKNISDGNFSLDGFAVRVRVKPCCLDEQGIAQRALVCVSLYGCNPEDVSENSIAEICRLLSEKFFCPVYMIRDQEFYGVANVYNGGSDYEVVNEKCFFCVYDCGQESFQESSDCWNEKARSMEQAFLASEISNRLLS